ncbi:MAG: HEAT repeat domain-containing protein [Syntrophobacteraceae bacterium]
MSNANPTPNGDRKPGQPSAQTLIQTAFPQQPTTVFIAAIVVGIFFICMTTIFRSSLVVNGMQSNLVLCIGASLVLAAFGGQATVRIGGIIMAGVAAVALSLFIYLQNSSHDLVLQGRIQGFDFVTYKSLEISQKNSILGRIVQNNSNPKRSHYDFAIFKQEIDSPILYVSLSRVGTGEERELRVRVSDFEWAFGDSQRLQWELREEADGPEKILTIYDLIKDTTIAREVTAGIQSSARTPIISDLTNAAFAQESAAIDLPLMLERLKADDAPTRHGARDALSQASVDSIPVIMETLRREASNYQVKLGICIALAQMLRTDKNRAAAISSRLTDDDLNQMLDAAGDPDRTVRLNAAEFLFDLGDTRTTKLAVPRAAGTSDENARFNWLLVSQDGWRKLSPAEKTALGIPLNDAKQRSGPKTLLLFDKLQM